MNYDEWKARLPEGDDVHEDEIPEPETQDPATADTLPAPPDGDVDTVLAVVLAHDFANLYLGGCYRCNGAGGCRDCG